MILQSPDSSLLIYFEGLMKKSYLTITISFKSISIHLTSCFLSINFNTKVLKVLKCLKINSAQSSC